MIKSCYTARSLRTAAKYHQVTHKTVKYWKDRFESEGVKGLSSRPRPGAPGKLDKAAKQRLKAEVLKQVRKEAFSTKQLRNFIINRTHISYTPAHIANLARGWGLSLITPRPLYVFAKPAERAAFLKENQETA